MANRIFTLKETADYLRICESRLRKMINSNEIASFKNGYRIYFTEQAIMEYLSLQEKKARGYELNKNMSYFNDKARLI